jgi:hypothetical protein
MFKPDLTKAELQSLIAQMSNLDFGRYRYCQEIAGTHLAVAKFEAMLISAMHMCDRVKLEKVLGPDTSHWKRSMTKRAALQGATLGSLIKILERHDIDGSDICYLKWIKDKRDYFVHRMFHDDLWPGELDEEDCKQMIRRLLAIQLWLSRAERNIWLIFERAGFVQLDHLGEGGLLATNMGIYDLDWGG